MTTFKAKLKKTLRHLNYLSYITCMYFLLQVPCWMFKVKRRRFKGRCWLLLSYLCTWDRRKILDIKREAQVQSWGAGPETDWVWWSHNWPRSLQRQEKRQPSQLLTGLSPHPAGPRHPCWHQTQNYRRLQGRLQGDVQTADGEAQGGLREPGPNGGMGAGRHCRGRFEAGPWLCAWLCGAGVHIK